MQDRQRLPRVDFITQSYYSYCKGLDRIPFQHTSVNCCINNRTVFNHRPMRTFRVLSSDTTEELQFMFRPGIECYNNEKA